MADKYLNLTGLSAIKNWIVTKLSAKQDKLTAGNGIAILNDGTINGTKVETNQTNGSVTIYAEDRGGGVSPGAALFVKSVSNGFLVSLGTEAKELPDAFSVENSLMSLEMFFNNKIGNLSSLNTDAKNNLVNAVNEVNGKTGQATDTTLGTVKLNPGKNITLNTDGQLEVGGRIGQFAGTTGLFAPDDRAPRQVSDYDLLVTDALGMNMTGNRSLAVVSGLGVTCKSAPAGSTEYRVTNNYTNRILCKAAEGGFASRDEATSKVEQIVQVVSVTINGSAFTPDSSANSSNDIVIKTSQSLNPTSAITSIRLFGTMGAYASIHTGNGIKSESGGRNLLLGGGVIKSGSANDNCLVGNGIFSNGNGVAAFGRYHVLRKNRGLFAGTGHDSTNAPSEGASAVGQYSYMDANTLLAVGIGSSHTDRKNAFEVRSDGVVLRSPNGTRYKISVDDSGNISTSAIT